MRLSDKRNFALRQIYFIWCKQKGYKPSRYLHKFITLTKERYNITF